MSNEISIHITREIAQSLCDQAEILIHENQIEGVPEGVLYDTVDNRWTWALDEAATWAVERLAEVDR